MNKKTIFCAAMALTFIFSGCRQVKPAESVVNTKVSSDASVTVSETTAETTKEPEPFTFNPHVHCSLLSEIVSEDKWQSFYNMVDAIRTGEDTFKCTDEAAYKWCTDEATIGNFYPSACTLVTGAGFENGTGRLKYKMDKEKLAARNKAFEEEIVRILNEATRSDYSDFEKLMSLYDYMCKNWVYDYSPLDGQGIDDFSDYACLTKRNGICCEIAGAFSYLLLQCGVEATPMGTSCEHDWTYVVIGGKGYHCDATWGVHGDNPEQALSLQYFMMTEAERLPQLNNSDQLEVTLIWPWKEKYDLARFSATDETFKAFHEPATYIGMDTVKKVIRYQNLSGETCELSYGNL